MDVDASPQSTVFHRLSLAFWLWIPTNLPEIRLNALCRLKDDCKKHMRITCDYMLLCYIPDDYVGIASGLGKWCKHKGLSCNFNELPMVISTYNNSKVIICKQGNVFFNFLQPIILISKFFDLKGNYYVFNIF